MSLTSIAAVLVLLGSIWVAPVQAMESRARPQQAEGGAVAALDSIDLEQRLQRLNWGQFKQVVEAIPKLKASVDAYGPLGWQYVQANYATYRWRKNIERLNADDRQRLAELIDKARMSR